MNRHRMLIFIEAPAGNVKFMNALVPAVAITCIPVPVPVVMKPFLVVFPVWCRAQPEIIMKGCRRFTVPGYTKRIARFIAQPPRHIYITYTTVMEELYCILYIQVRPALKTDLNTDIIFTRSFYHFPSLKNIVTCRFFNIYMFACLACPDCSKSMPVVWRSK